MKIGFIGLGIMGSRMAANLQKNGYNLIVHNRTKANAEALLEAGALWGNTPADVAVQVDILITMLSAPEVISQAALGEQGFLDRLMPEALWVNCSTVNPSFSKQMAKEARARQIRFLDAPVAGTKEPAEKGELLFIVGGDPTDVEACRPLFEVMGRGIAHIGEPGMGSAMKVVVNIMLAEAMLSFSEALTLGQSLGIPREVLLNNIPGSAIAAPFLSNKKIKIEAGDYEAEFPLQWMYKDLQLAATTAHEQEIALPMANAAKEIYALAKQYGWGEADFSAVYRFVSEG